MQDLYREVVLERYRKPHHRRPLPEATAHAYTHNPLCGDELSVFLRIEDTTVVDAAFDAHGCSISQASADLMVDLVIGQSVEQAGNLIDAFEGMLRDADDRFVPELGEAQVLRAVRRYPVRVKCALLAWETLREALATRGDSRPE